MPYIKITNISLTFTAEENADLTLLISILERLGYDAPKKRLYNILMRYAINKGITKEDALQEIASKLQKKL